MKFHMALMAVVLLAVSCGGGEGRDRDSAPTVTTDSSAPSSTVAETSTTLGADDANATFDVDLDSEAPESYQPTVDEALRLFADAFAAVPGSPEPTPPGRTGDPEEAVSAVGAVRSQLTPEQQAAIDAAMAADLDFVGAIGPDGVLVDPAGNAVESLPSDAAPPSSAGRRARSAQDTGAQRQILLEELAQIRRDLDGLLGTRLELRAGLSVERTPRPAGESTAWAVASAGNALLGGIDCHIVAGQALATTNARDVRSLLAHELFHCYQFENFPGSLEEGQQVPKWVREGSASWVGERYVNGSTTPLAREWWEIYLRGQSNSGVRDGRFSLFHSDYDAVGYFFHLESLGVDMWNRVLPATELRTSTSAFEFLNFGVEDAMTGWGASVLRMPAWGASWDASVVGSHDARRTPHAIDVGFDAYSNSLRVLLGYNGVTEFRFPAAVQVADVNVTGAAVTSWNSSDETRYSNGGRTLWCLGRTCLCPDGTPPAGVTLKPTVGGTPLTAALAGIRGPARVDVRAMMTEELCTPPVCGGEVGGAGAGRRSRSAAVQPVEPPTDPRCEPEAPTGPECLIGAWAYDASTLPLPPQVAAAPLENVRFSGQFVVTFGADAIATVSLDGYRMDASAPLAGADGVESPQPVSVVFYGTLVNSWSADAGAINLSYTTGSLGADVTMTLPGAGEFVFPFPPGAVNGLVPALAGGAGGANTSTYECTATSLTLTNAAGQPFSLQRL